MADPMHILNNYAMTLCTGNGDRAGFLGADLYATMPENVCPICMLLLQTAHANGINALHDLTARTTLLRLLQRAQEASRADT